MKTETKNRKFFIATYIVAETFSVDYDKHVPVITVHNGKVMKAGDQLFFYPGFGQERTIRAPGMFAADFE